MLSTANTISIKDFSRKRRRLPSITASSPLKRLYLKKRACSLRAWEKAPILLKRKHTRFAQKEVITSFCAKRVCFLFNNIGAFSHARSEHALFFKYRRFNGLEAVIDGNLRRFLEKSLILIVFAVDNILHSPRTSKWFLLP